MLKRKTKQNKEMYPGKESLVRPGLNIKEFSFLLPPGS